MHGEFPCHKVEARWLMLSGPGMGDGEHASECTSDTSSVAHMDACRIDRGGKRKAVGGAQSVMDWLAKEPGQLLQGLAGKVLAQREMRYEQWVPHVEAFVHVPGVEFEMGLNAPSRFYGKHRGLIENDADYAHFKIP